MAVEKITPDQEKVTGIVDKQIADYAVRYKENWPGNETAFGVMALTTYVDICLEAYRDKKLQRFNMVYEKGKNEFENFFDTFFRDVAGVVGVPFPSTGREDKLRVAEAAKDGLTIWTRQQNMSAH